jgi:hypothetical protein
MKNPRHMVVKGMFSDDEYNELKQACEEEGIAHSSVLRLLVKEWLRQRKSSKSEVQSRRPEMVHKLSLPCANSRVNYGVAPVRLRI